MSAKSDKFEKDVATQITKMWKGFGLKAERPSVGTEYSDVRLKYKNKFFWLEVKMNHTDNLANPRVFYTGTQWKTTYKTPAAEYSVKQLNSGDSLTRKFLKEINNFSGIHKAKIPTTKGGLKDGDAVPLKKMKQFFDDKIFNSRYILDKENVDIASLVTKHYTIGKAEPAYYMQAGDDFYLISTKDPLGLNKGLRGKKKIPVLSGKGNFRVRVATRSQFYEVQAEIKIKTLKSSPYSLLKGTKKLNPFTNLLTKDI
jgi:hypothetical protein